MIVVDASAIVAILLREPEAHAFRELMLAADEVRLSPVGYWEAATRLRGLRGAAGLVELDEVINGLAIRIAPATTATARLACEAETIWGKRTAARLNMGDCFAYALAKELGAPLLYKGEDFSRTDIQAAFTA
ncbi:type II toxin-antitoxin system VapC family toxin [Brevundimonas sp.]|uniref:type II toxin-antitoxin system VapC family toxin n=1 Tax=Brevundimonas sp. TaxID=1871086 RepID=UPI003F7118C0